MRPGAAAQSLTPYLFSAASLGLLLLSLVLRPAPSAGLDIYLFDTYFVVVHTQILLAAAILQAGFALTYFVFPALTRSSFRRTLGLLHFSLTILATAFIASVPYVAPRLLHEDPSSAGEYLAAGPVFLMMGQVPFLLLLVRDKVKSV